MEVVFLCVFSNIIATSNGALQTAYWRMSSEDSGDALAMYGALTRPCVPAAALHSRTDKHHSTKLALENYKPG